MIICFIYNVEKYYSLRIGIFKNDFVGLSRLFIFTFSGKLKKCKQAKYIQIISCDCPFKYQEPHFWNGE